MTLKITVVGTGYVGLVSGVCFAEIGHDVTCIDSNAAKIQKLQNGEIPIYEPGLDDLVKSNVAAKRLHFSTDLSAHIENRDAIFIAVGTPTAADGVSADLSAVQAVARSLAPHLKSGQVIVTKSTVPVGSNKMVEEIILKSNPSAKFSICSNPEFLREGAAIEDFMQPDRIVIGVRNKNAQAVMEKLYALLTKKGAKLVVTTPESAEIIKYAANALLATKIAFINEVADLAEASDADITDIALGVGLDSRIGAKFLQSGPGYGGSCFPKDTRAFAQMGRKAAAPSAIIEAVIKSNDDRKQAMYKRIISILGGNIAGRKIALLGVTFKANTDDMRESVSLDLVPQLLLAGAEIHAFDPGANDHARQHLPQSVLWHESAEATLDNADALIILTEWPQFKSLDLNTAKRKMKQPVLVDLRNLFDATAALKAGFDYHSIGRKPQKPSDNAQLRVVK
jgi:UDPglucose 6-dehydrogenase